MQAEESVDRVRSIWEEVWNRGRLEAVDDILTDDYVGHIPAVPAPVRGRDGFKQLVVAYRTAYPDVHVTVEDMIVGRDRVVVRWTSHGTNTGEFMGMPATGRSVDVDGISIFRIRDARVAEEWEGFDTLAMMQQLGVVDELAA
jgi:steroid delta-isomerase-like uncharacterized protein